MNHLLTQNVFIDTEFFDSIKLNLRSRSAEALLTHAHQGRIKLFLTTITEGENRRHFRDQVRQAATALNGIASDWIFLKTLQSHPLQILLTKVDKKGLVGMLDDYFTWYLDESNATILDLSSVDASSIFDDYFSLKPPFKEGNKKHEFPDAFAIQVLESWCKENKEQMYVVSRDKDWKSSCEISNSLVHVEAVETILDLVIKEQKEAQAQQAVEYFQQNKIELERQTRERFLDRGFYVDDEDGEVTEVVVINISFEEPSVITIEELETVLSVEVTIEFEAHMTINDVAHGSYDKEDRRWMYLPTRSGSVIREENPRVLITLDYNPDESRYEGFTVDLDEISETIYVDAAEWTTWPIDSDLEDDDEPDE